MEIINNLKYNKLYDVTERAKMILREVVEENLLSIIHVFDANYDDKLNVFHLTDRDKHYNIFIKDNEEVPKVVCAEFDEDLMHVSSSKYEFINKITDLDTIKDEDIRKVIQKAFEDVHAAVSF
jgi:hypothetical protein